jgi:hypothetical protein
MKGHSSNTSSITPISEPPKLSREDVPAVEVDEEEAAVAAEHSESAGLQEGAVGPVGGEKGDVGCKANIKGRRGEVSTPEIRRSGPALTAAAAADVKLAVAGGGDKPHSAFATAGLSFLPCPAILAIEPPAAAAASPAAFGVCAAAG